MMIDQANRTFICSVVFVDLVGYSKKSVTEQISIKDRFTALLSGALKDIAVNDRIILDTGDGAAMSFLGDPEDALFVAMTLRDAIGATNPDDAGALGRDEDDSGILRIGINLGPVKLVKDINGHPNIIGDGINVAQRIMSFAKAGQIVVSRSYFDVVSVISEEYGKLFQYEGSRTDKHVREHEIYVVGQSDAAFLEAKSGIGNRAAQTNPKARAKRDLGVNTGTFKLAAQPGLEGASPGFFQDRKKVIGAGAILALAVVLLIILVVNKNRPTHTDMQPAEQLAALTSQPVQATPSPALPGGATIPAETAPIAGNPGVAPEASRNAAPAAVPAETKAAPSSASRPAKPEPPNPEPVKAEIPPGTVNLAIAPWGEVFVNGKSRGVSPPVKSIKLAPGKYKVEIKNATLAPHIQAIEVKSREEITVRHKF